MEILIAMVWLALWVGSAVACWVIANNKARLAGVWALLGFFLGPLVVLAILVLPSLERDKNAPTPKTHVKCPDCRELVLIDAKVCKHCGCRLTPLLA